MPSPRGALAALPRLPRGRRGERVRGAQLGLRGQWLGDKLGRPAICTFKCALRVWPEAPAHNNQTLRYWLRPKGLSVFARTPIGPCPTPTSRPSSCASCSRLATVEELIAWTAAAGAAASVTFGKHRGSDWKDVPLDYLDWVVAKSDMDEDVKFTAQHHRRARRARLLERFNVRPCRPTRRHHRRPGGLRRRLPEPRFNNGHDSASRRKLEVCGRQISGVRDLGGGAWDRGTSDHAAGEPFAPTVIGRMLGKIEPR